MNFIRRLIRLIATGDPRSQLEILAQAEADRISEQLSSMDPYEAKEKMRQIIVEMNRPAKSVVTVTMNEGSWQIPKGCPKQELPF